MFKKLNDITKVQDIICCLLFALQSADRPYNIVSDSYCKKIMQR